MLYEIATLSAPLLRLDTLAQRARSWIDDPEAAGRFLGMWRSDIGTLGQVLVLRAFDTEQQQRAERQRALFSINPFHANDVCTALSMETYSPFSFLPPVRPRSYGGLFEFRTYRLRPGGLPATLAGWKDAIIPAKRYTDHLVVNMYALDGPPRITHIWGFSSLDERRSLRAQHYAAKLWPPRGCPEQIASATSAIAVAEPDSPLG